MGTSNPSRLRVLLVEDDPRVAGAVTDGFTAKGIALHHAPTIAEGCRALVRGGFDAIILDLSLPDGDGAVIADFCRDAGRDIPIIMVTAQDSVRERIAGLARGADDYLCKPFALEELLARLEAVLRRSRPKHRHILTYRDVELDLLKRRLRRDEIETALSAREVDLLAYLIKHPEEILSKDRILKDVWGDEAEQSGNVLQVYINYLRNKLEAGVYPRLIHTIRGVGYVLSREEPEAALAEGEPWS